MSLNALKWLILRYVDLTLIKRNLKKKRRHKGEGRGGSPRIRSDRKRESGVPHRASDLDQDVPLSLPMEHVLTQAGQTPTKYVCP